ncbi:unnamed protein product [Rotaria sordida]|uniref:Uncharacterized protein n=1 Tax=Rotaria sordida TaxID=392033 RepID=A0A819P8J2_9BILA|nr:unnamed protein product [Rotaria sordida]CAF4010789.1 unnamed protein product [Rotaria sordida]
MGRKPVAITGDVSMDKEVEAMMQNAAKEMGSLDWHSHASLTPLHIVCDCLSSNAIDIVRQLLEHGAHVNAESLPSGQEYLSLTDPSVIDIHRINDSVPHGRTPLHIVCTLEATEDTLSLVRLLEHHANPNAVCNGRTLPSLAIIPVNERLVDLLINHETTDPLTSRGLGNGNVLRAILSTAQESQWTYAKRLELVCKESIKKNLLNLYFICILNLTSHSKKTSSS